MNQKTQPDVPERRESISLRLPPSELQLLDRYIALSRDGNERLYGRRVNRSNVIRAAVRCFLQMEILITRSKEFGTLSDLSYELRAIANNLNQLAKAYHAGMLINPVNSEDLFESLIKQQKEIREQINTILDQALGRSALMDDETFKIFERESP